MITTLIFYSGISGISIFIGGLLANIFNHHIEESPVKYVVTHSLMSFGAGIILSALTLVLIPEGLKELHLFAMTLSFLLGAFLFMFLNSYLSKRGGNTATLLAMMMDFIPESIALGAVFASEPNMAMFLALIISLQNLPEAFNAFRDLVISGFSTWKTLIIFFFLSFFGVIGALMGHFILSDRHVLTAHLMTFASGGILYLLIQDIIPESKLEKNHLTSLGAILGFLIGIIGIKLV